MAAIGIALALLLSACAAAPAAEPVEPVSPETQRPDTPLTIVVASDLHYLSRKLTDNGPLFQQVAAAGDGKLMLQIEAITEAFVEQIIRERPDVLILSGDISYNGEYQSHVDLAEKLRRIQDAGIPVLVMPGNHDILVPYTFRFEGESCEKVKNTNAYEFREIYEEFGYAGALSFDENSYSYIYPVGDGLRVLMLDTNSLIRNAFPEKSLPWLEEQLRLAQEEGARVISVSHQNLLEHNGLFISGYRISNALELRRLLARYGVMAHLSGHMHIQHVTEDGIPELLTSPLSLTPCRYGQLSYDGSSLRYEARSVDVAGWAEEQGSDDEILLHFSAYARESFYQNSYNQIFSSFAESELPKESVRRMADVFAGANLAYFTGEPLDRDALAEGLEFWIDAAGESLHTAYLRSILKDEAPSPLKIVLWTATKP